MLRWLRRKKRAVVTGAFAPVYLDSIKLICPECGAWGMWPLPEGFRAAISDKILVVCENGHNWAVSGVYERIAVEQK
jgi:hypothetical protein